MAKVKVARGRDVLEIDSEKLSEAADLGYEPVTAEEAKRTADVREAATISGGAQGLGEGVARGVTLGLSDVGLRALGADMGGVAARAEGLGSKGAELAGAVGTALLTGGGSAAGSAARTAARFTPAGLAARAGTAAERAFGTSALGGRVLGTAAQGAVEGALAGVGAEASRAALGDEALAAERLVAGGFQGLGIGALLGGGLGVAGAGVERAAAGAARAGQGALQGLRRGAGEAGETLADLSPREAAFAKAGRFMAKLQGRAPEPYERLFGGVATRKGRDRILADVEDLRVSAAKDIKAAADAMNEGAEEAVQIAYGATRHARAEKLLAPLDVPGIKGANGRFVRRPRGHALDHLEKHEQRLRDELEDELLSKEEFADISEALRLNERAQRNAHEVKNAAQAFREVNDYKQSVDAIARRRLDQYKNNKSPEAFKAWKKARSFSDETRAHLENADLYGEEALVQKRVNAAAAADFAAQENLTPQLRAFMEKGAQADTEVAMSLARGSTRYGGQSKQDAFQAALDARLNFIRTTIDEFDLDPAQLEKLKRGEQLIEDMRSKLDELSETAQVADDLSKARKDEGGGSPSLTLLSTIGPAGGAGIGFMLAGPLGAAVGGLAGMALRPFTLARAAAAGLNMLDGLGKYRGAVENVASREASIAAGFDRLAEGGRSAVRTSARAVRRGAAGAGRRAVRDEPETRPQRQARLMAVRAAVMAAAADPLELATQMEGGVAELHDFAPEVARGIVERSAVAVTFLASKVPDVYEPAFGNGKPIVAPEELDRFERYVNAVQDPLGAVEKVMTGSLSLEHAEALRVVYPKIYAEMQSKALEMLGRRKQEGRRISDESLVQLGLMLDMPLTDSLKPGFLASLQSPAMTTPGPDPTPAAPRAPKPIEVTARRTDLGRLEAGELRS